MDVCFLQHQDISRLKAEALDPLGNLLVMPSAFYAEFRQEQLSYFAQTHAFYLLPTVELIERLQVIIGDRSTIEIGSGNGVLGRALGIPMTDSFVQEQLEIKLHYALIGQPTVNYGADVEKLDAISAVQKYDPDIVIGSWITQLYKTGTDFRQNSSVYGVDEGLLLKHCDTYIHIGNIGPHGDKRINNRLGERVKPAFLFSRSINPAGNLLDVFEGGKA